MSLALTAPAKIQRSIRTRVLATLLTAFCGYAGHTFAALIGSHDGADVTATWGWVCNTAQPATPVSVFFYAYASGTFTQIGSTVANFYRADVASAGVCGGNGYHGFVFTTYPQSGSANIVDAQSHDIYAYVYHNGFILLPGSPQNVSFAPTGLWDPGLLNGRWRTDYFSQTAGLSSNNLLLLSAYDTTNGGDCWWATGTIVPGGAGYLEGQGHDCITAINDAASFTTPPAPSDSYAQTYAASSDGDFGAPNFWVITANSEGAYVNAYTDGHSGPADQTEAISTPGQGLYALDVLSDTQDGLPNRKKAHLIINKPQDVAGNLQCTTYGICKQPFLSYGVESDWGNGHGVITLLNYPGAASTLNFAVTLMDIGGASSDSQTVYLFVEADWCCSLNGQNAAVSSKRWAYITLFDKNGTADNYNAHHFNWNILQGLWFPGADIAFKSVDQLNNECNARVSGWPALQPMQVSPVCTYNNHCSNARQTYSIPLGKLFACLSSDFTAPMPSGGYIPITGIHFAVEQGPSPDAYTWIAIDSVELQ